MGWQAGNHRDNACEARGRQPEGPGPGLTESPWAKVMSGGWTGLQPPSRGNSWEWTSRQHAGGPGGGVSGPRPLSLCSRGSGGALLALPRPV